MVNNWLIRAAAIPPHVAAPFLPRDLAPQLRPTYSGQTSLWSCVCALAEQTGPRLINIFMIAPTGRLMACQRRPDSILISSMLGHTTRHRPDHWGTCANSGVISTSARSISDTGQITGALAQTPV